MQKGMSPAHLHFAPWDLALTGAALDDRGRAVEAFIRSNVSQTVSLQYQPDDTQLTIDGSVVDASQVEGFLLAHKGKSLLLETTTLGFAEVFLCCRAAYQLGFPGISLLYVEPGDYRKLRRAQVLHRRHFELSGYVEGYRALPGASFILDDKTPQTVIFFLGYEERRMDRALNDFSIRPSRTYVVFGVPAYQPGWEMDAFANNIRVIRDQGITTSPLFCGAENPLGAYEILEDTLKTLEANEQLFLGPIGTKPHGIAVALFAACHDKVGILYDHPRRTADRTSATYNWHLFNAEF
jgi:hypothetical protein